MVENRVTRSFWLNVVDIHCAEVAHSFGLEDVGVGLFDLFNKAEFFRISLPGFIVHRPLVGHVAGVVQVNDCSLHILGT